MKSLQQIGARVSELNTQLANAGFGAQHPDERVRMQVPDQLGFAETVLREVIDEVSRQPNLSLELTIGNQPIMPADYFPHLEAISAATAFLDHQRRTDLGITALSAGSILKIDNYVGRGRSFAVGPRQRLMQLPIIAKIIHEKGFFLPVDYSPTESDS